MKFKFLLIGLALALMLCISPVAAVSGDDFEVVIDKSGDINTYKYCNKNTPGEKYIELHSDGTHWLNSIVTFKPANIPNAPMMVVSGRYPSNIYLPKSVDEWEIKYYSRPFYSPSLDVEFLKNADVVNLKEFFGDHVDGGLYLWLSLYQVITTGPVGIDSSIVYYLKDVVDIETYTYSYVNSSNEKYIEISIDHTNILYSRVTFKPADIPDAPTMVVYTSNVNANVYLPKSVDEWEIKYYSRFLYPPSLDVEFLKNADVVNLKEFFGDHVDGGLLLELNFGQYIYTNINRGYCRHIPSVD